jgi:hypothetical protein
MSEPDQPEIEGAESPQSKNRLLNQQQHKQAYKLYVGMNMAPRHVAVELNHKFGTKFTSRQITEYVRARGWSAKKKILKREVIDPANHELMKSVKRDLTKQHADFLEASARISAKALVKAETFIDRANSPRDLHSSIGAARLAGDMFRKSVGLGENEGITPRTQINVFNVGFARGEGSPFAANFKAAQSDDASTQTIDGVVTQALQHDDDEEDDDDSDEANDPNAVGQEIASESATEQSS